MNRKSVGIVDLGAEVDAAQVGLVLAEEVHRCERGDADLRDLLAEENAGAHFHGRLDARLYYETIRTGHAARIEKGIDRELRRGGLRPFDPEFRECRKFLARAERRVDGKTARRDAVDLPFAERAEIACAEKGDDLVFVARRVERVMD